VSGREICAVQCNLGLKVSGVGYELLDLRLHDPVDQDSHEPIGQLEHLNNLGDGAVLIDIVGSRFVNIRVFLGHEKNVLAPLERLVGGSERRLTAHENGENHEGEHNNISQRQHRESRRDVVKRLDG